MSDRWYILAICLAYVAAGAILALGCIVLLHAADEVNNAPFCRRI
jgi:hypothetical protein